MSEVSQEQEPFYEKGRRRLLRTARFVGRAAVGVAQNFVDIGHEIVDQEKYSELRKAANINSVNGCLTRRGMFRALDDLLETDTPDQLLVTFVDAKGFKLFNDNFGQNTGDLALAVTGWGLREIFKPDREIDTDALVGSWGGDEFLCVLPAGASMNQDSFGDSLEFEFEKNQRSGTVTWHFKDFLNGLQDTHHAEVTTVYRDIKNLVNRGVDSIAYRYTFDVIDVNPNDTARDIVDTFAEHNTIKNATYLRKPR